MNLYLDQGFDDHHMLNQYISILAQIHQFDVDTVCSIPIYIPIQLVHHLHQHLHPCYQPQDLFQKHLLLSNMGSYHHHNHSDKYQTIIHNHNLLHYMYYHHIH